MGKDHEERDVIVIERDGGAGFGAVLLGALLGLAAGMLFAPRSGAETRRMLSKRLEDAKDLAEDTVQRVGDRISEGIGEAGPTRSERRARARGDLERRLADARARRSRVAEEDADEEPVG
jgi:gas vesicle protein